MTDQNEERPALVAARVVLRPFMSHHITDDYIAWLNDPVVVRYSEQRHRHHDRASCERFRRAKTAPGEFFWAVETRQDGHHIGNVTATEDAPNKVAELAIMIGNRAVWGTGLGTEAWAAASEYLLKSAGVRKLVAGTMSTNAAMLSIFRKTAMREDGVRARYFVWEGREIDLLQFTRFSDSQ